jgi:hypothetical protein
METKIFNLNQTCSVAIISQQNQPSQSSQNMSSSEGFFITLAFTICVLGCGFILRKSQKRRQKWDEIIQALQTLEKTQDENLSPQMRQQIETLEKIWNKSP